MKTSMGMQNAWKFYFGELTPETAADAAWEPVTIPHTWNALDGQDGGGDYKRGAGWYQTTFTLHKVPEMVYFVEFLGVNAVADVYLNGVHLGQHRGGYTLFRFALTDALKDGENTLLVCANNAPFPDVIPLQADFTFFGGIYRDVRLIAAHKVHFDLTHFGSDGVALSYPNSPNIRTQADLQVHARVHGVDAQDCHMEVQVCVPAHFESCPGIAHTDFDVASVLAAEETVVATAVATVQDGVATCSVPLAQPHLWNGRQDPFRYFVVCTLYCNGEAVDTVRKAVGFRYFSIHPRKGFFLNGVSYPLRGVNRHQDRENMGWAITEKEHDEDFSILYEIGANAVRLAHYPHHPHFYERCDQYGLLVWAEIPFVDHIGGCGISPLPTDKNPDPAVTARQLANAQQQMTELIAQQQYRPSIFCWSMSNEVMREYGETAANMMQKLDDLIHALDSTRPSALATNNYVGERWCADIKGCNIYPGWYWGSARQFRVQAAAHMRANQRRGVAVSEYGAGSNVLHHTETPTQPKNTVCDFHPEEWASIVHEHALRFFMAPKNNRIWGAFVWNLFDFAIDSRNEGALPGRNDKGLVTYDRQTKKDPFYLYKAYWSREPVTYITSRRFTVREKPCICVKVYSNAQTVTLVHNGATVQSRAAKRNRQKHVFLFRNVKLVPGTNTVVAVGDNGVSDEVVWQLQK